MSGLSEDVRAWLFDQALPFWADVGVDRVRPGFVEELDVEGRPAERFRRVRVAARQTYVFAHAAVLGWAPGREIAEAGFERLVRFAWLGPERGWARRLSVDGEVIDATPDLYDIAFVLYAAAWVHRLTGATEPLDVARRTLDFMNARLRPASGPGFLEALPASGPKLQNPHMHLLEAALALSEHGDDPRFDALADELSSLFFNHLFDPGTGTLGERFDRAWTREADERGRCVEPGHHFEWVWLLAELNRIRGLDDGGAGLALHAFAERHGVDPHTKAVRNAVRDDGAVIDGASRTWPNCERLKAGVAVFEREGRDTRPMLEQSGRLLLDRYFARTPRGTWHDTLEADGRMRVGTVPTSSFYHVFLSFSEVLRIAPVMGI